MDTFMERGFIVLKGAFSKEKCAEWTKDVWVRLGVDPADKSTHAAAGKDRVHMPDHNKERVETFAPRVSTFFVHGLFLLNYAILGLGCDERFVGWRRSY